MIFESFVISLDPKVPYSKEEELVPVIVFVNCWARAFGILQEPVIKSREKEGRSSRGQPANPQKL